MQMHQIAPIKLAKKKKEKKNNKVVEKTVSGSPAIIHENAALPSIVAYQV